MEKENQEKENLLNENMPTENMPTEKMPTENMPTENIVDSQVDIRHLVLSGGGIWGFKLFGALREAHNANMLDISKIESIFCTSVGSMIGVLLCMKFDFTTIEDYLIKRPWQQVWSVNMNHILNIFQTRGIYQQGFMREYLLPFFKAHDYDENITMLEFYEKTGIEFHVYITEMNEFKCIDVSYKTHAEWPVVDVIYMSCSVPIVFSPIIRENKCYVDGSLLMNYPLCKCIEYIGIQSADKILSIFLTSEDNPESIEKKDVSETSSFFDYIMVLMQRFLQSRIFLNDMSYRIRHEMRMSSPEFTLEYIDACIKSVDQRREIVEEGAEKMREWIKTLDEKIE